MAFFRLIKCVVVRLEIVPWEFVSTNGKSGITNENSIHFMNISSWSVSSSASKIRITIVIYFFLKGEQSKRKHSYRNDHNAVHWNLLTFIFVISITIELDKQKWRRKNNYKQNLGVDRTLRQWLLRTYVWLLKVANVLDRNMHWVVQKKREKSKKIFTHFVHGILCFFACNFYGT